MKISDYFFTYSKQIEVQKDVNEKINGFFSRCGSIARTPWTAPPCFWGIFKDERIVFSVSGSLLRKTVCVGPYAIAESCLNYLKEKEQAANKTSAFIGRTFLKLDDLIGFFTIGKGIATAVALIARVVSFVAFSALAIFLTGVYFATLTSLTVIAIPVWVPIYIWRQQKEKIERSEKIIEIQPNEIKNSGTEIIYNRNKLSTNKAKPDLDTIKHIFENLRQFHKQEENLLNDMTRTIEIIEIQPDEVNDSEIETISNKEELLINETKLDLDKIKRLMEKLVQLIGDRKKIFEDMDYIVNQMEHSVN